MRSTRYSSFCQWRMSCHQLSQSGIFEPSRTYADTLSSHSWLRLQ